MKVLYLIPTYVPAYKASGVISFVHGLNKWLVRLGAEVTVYTTNADAWHDTIDVPIGVPVTIDGVTVFYFKTTFPRRWFYSRAFHKKVAETIGNFDVVHITSAFLAISTIGGYYARKFHKPYLINNHGSLMREPLKQRTLLKKTYISLLESRNLAGAAAIIFSVEKEKEEYTQTKLPLQKGVVIFAGVDPEVFSRDVAKDAFRKKLNIPDHKKIVLYLGRIYWIKGFDTLIPAFAEVAKEYPDVVLAIAGFDEGGYEKEVNRLIDENNVRDNIVLTGPLFGKEKEEALSGSDAFVLSSYTEAGSIASIEALYFGLPVVITKNCGLAYEIGEAGAGLVVEKNVEDLAKALLKVLKDQPAAQEMSRNARTFAREELTLNKIAIKFMSLYAAVVASQARERK